MASAYGKTLVNNDQFLIRVRRAGGTVTLAPHTAELTKQIVFGTYVQGSGSAVKGMVKFTGEFKVGGGGQFTSHADAFVEFEDFTSSVQYPLAGPERVAFTDTLKSTNNGQTGWLQGLRYGFIFDATLNDFVAGEMERTIVQCSRETNPDIILLEGQSALRNPAGPAGSEFICSARAVGVILQHAPARTHFEDFERLGCTLPPLSEELELIRLLGAEVWGISLYTHGLKDIQSAQIATELKAHHGVPVVRPLEDGVERLVTIIRQKLPS